MSPPDAGLDSKFHSFRQVQVLPDSTLRQLSPLNSIPLLLAPPKPQPSPVQLLTRPPAPLHLNRRGSIVLVTAKKKPAQPASLGLATSNGGRGEGDRFPSLDIIDIDIDIDRGRADLGEKPVQIWCADSDGQHRRTDRKRNYASPAFPCPFLSSFPFLPSSHFYSINLTTRKRRPSSERSNPATTTN